MDALTSLKYFIPELVLLGGGFTVLIADLFSKNKRLIAWLSLAVLAVTACLAKAPAVSQPLFFDFFTLDAFTHFFRYAALGTVAVTILISLAYEPISENIKGEYYSLFLFMAFALVLMGASTNLLMILLSIEFVSILSYLLVGFLKRNLRAKEAAIKYLLYGSLATGVMLYGMSLIYGATGSIELEMIGKVLAARPHLYAIAFASLIFILVGLGFKISLAPFHMWAPDVYEAAPTPVTAFLTVGPKALGFAVLMRVLAEPFLVLSSHWNSLMIVLAILTMTVGNVVAVAQTNIKRLLAYSSIAQAGYILMGIAAATELGSTAVLVYLVAYAFTNLGAFTAVIIASNRFRTDEIQAYAGLGRRAPFLAASLTIFLLSLAGIPPLVGFIGKFYVFSAAITSGLYMLAVVAAVNSAVAAYYYFKVVRVIYLTPAEENEPLAFPPSLKLALFLLLAGTLFFGILPGPVIGFVQSALLV